jgi:hypothetical protein
MDRTVVLIFCWLMLIGSGCGNRSARVQTETPEDRHPVIVHLEMRNEVVTVMSGYEGPAYTVTAKDGRILGEHLSEQELRAELPDIHRFLKTSYAENEKTSVAWAGI